MRVVELLAERGIYPVHCVLSFFVHALRYSRCLQRTCQLALASIPDSTCPPHRICMCQPLRSPRMHCSRHSPIPYRTSRDCILLYPVSSLHLNLPTSHLPSGSHSPQHKYQSEPTHLPHVSHTLITPLPSNHHSPSPSYAPGNLFKYSAGTTNSPPPVTFKCAHSG